MQAADINAQHEEMQDLLVSATAGNHASNTPGHPDRTRQQVQDACKHMQPTTGLAGGRLSMVLTQKLTLLLQFTHCIYLTC